MREKESGWKNSMWKKLRRRSTSIHEVFINPLTTCEILNVCRDSFFYKNAGSRPSSQSLQRSWDLAFSFALDKTGAQNLAQNKSEHKKAPKFRPFASNV